MNIKIIQSRNHQEKVMLEAEKKVESDRLKLEIDQLNLDLKKVCEKKDIQVDLLKKEMKDKGGEKNRMNKNLSNQ